VTATFKQSLSLRKQAAQQFEVERFNLMQLSKLGNIVEMISQSGLQFAIT
jgi:hypothetical protein